MIKAIRNSVNSIIDGNFHKYIHFIRQVAVLYSLIKQTSTLSIFKRATLLFVFGRKWNFIFVGIFVYGRK